MAGKGAPRGNKYAEKEGTGKRIGLYLSVEDMDLLRYVLAQYEQDITDTACYELARKAAKVGIDTLLRPEFYLLVKKRGEKVDTIIKASGPGPSWVEIKRIGGEMSDPNDERNHMNLTEKQGAAYQQALNHVKLNNIEAARTALEGAFEWVRIEQGE